jgi:hypothetical protein
MSVTIGNYEARNLGICPDAISAFAEYDSELDADQLPELEKALRAVDQCCGIMKKAYAAGELSSSDFDEFLHYLDDAENALDLAGELDSHYYLRDVLEMAAVEMYDLSDIDLDDEAEEHSNLEQQLFGDDTPDEEAEPATES